MSTRSSLAPFAPEVLMALAETSDLAEALATILDAALTLEGVDCGGIYQREAVTGDTVLVCHRGFRAGFEHEVGRYSADSPNARLLAAGEAVFGRYADVRVSRGEAQDAEGLRALGVIPLLRHGEVLAALNIASHSVDEFSSEAQAGLGALAAAVGSVIGRIQAETALRESQRDLHLLFDSMDDLLFIADTEGRVIHTNPAVSAAMGFTAEELRGRHLVEMHPPERREEATRLLLGALSGEQVLCRVPLLAKDGRHLPVETRPMRGQWAGQPALIGLTRDVSERQRLQDTLERQERLLRMVVENASEGAYRRDLRRDVYDYLSPSFERMLGYRISELMNLTTAETIAYLHPDDRERVAAAGARSLAGALPDGEVEFRFRAADGSYRWLADRYQGVADAEGRPRYRVGMVQDVTERRQAEQALRASEEQHRSVVDAMAEGVVLQGLDGAILACNPRAEEILGLTRDELLGRTSIDPRWRSVHADGSTFAGVDHPAMVTLRTGQPSRDVLMGVHRHTSELVWININTEPVRDTASGELSGVVSTFADITERREAELTLRDSEEKYRVLFDNDLVAICIFDPATMRFHDVNRAFENLYGWTRAELLGGMTVNDITVEPEASAEATQQAVRQGTQFVPLRWHRKRDGTLVAVEIVGGLYEWRRQPVMFGLILDISERLRAQDALRASEERFRRQFEQSVDARMITDENGCLLDCNQACLELFACPTRDTVLGKFVGGWSPPLQPDGSDSVAEGARRGAEALSTGSAFFTWQHRRFDGTDFQAEVLLSRMSLAGRNVLEVTVRDVTERLLAEADLREREARYRALASENEQLLSQSSADAAAKGRLLHEVNHRVKNNLAAILGLLELARGHGGGVHEDQWARLLDGLTGRVRSLSIAHAQLAEASWEPLLLSELAERVVRPALAILPDGLACTVSVPAARVLVPPKQAGACALILSELATNAVKHAARPGQPLSLTVGAWADAETTVCEFRDNGPGFSPAVLAGTRTSTGLELVSLMAQHDLRGSVELSNDSGAVVRVRFPAHANLPAEAKERVV